jgi:hypothetical protein
MISHPSLQKSKSKSPFEMRCIAFGLSFIAAILQLATPFPNVTIYTNANNVVNLHKNGAYLLQDCSQCTSYLGLQCFSASLLVLLFDGTRSPESNNPPRTHSHQLLSTTLRLLVFRLLLQ